MSGKRNGGDAHYRQSGNLEIAHLQSPSTHNILKKIYAVNGADIAVIILIGQEKIHLKRCVEKCLDESGIEWLNVCEK